MDQWLARVDRLSCAPSDTALCLNGGRFRVEAEWRTPQGRTGRARAVPLTADTGYFWFFGAANVEAVVKVLDACTAPTPRFWVFAAGLTDVEVDLTVADTASGEVRASGLYRVSAIFERRKRLSGPGASFSAIAPLRRRGLRRRLTVALAFAALGPVIAVSLVAVLLIFSSVEQGIEFEAVRGLQVARGLLLQQVQRIAAGAAGVGQDQALLRALADKSARCPPADAPSNAMRSTSMPSTSALSAMKRAPAFTS